MVHKCCSMGRSPFEPARAISEQECQDMEIATSVESKYSDTDEKSKFSCRVSKSHWRAQYNCPGKCIAKTKSIQLFKLKQRRVEKIHWTRQDKL